MTSHIPASRKKTPRQMAHEKQARERFQRERPGPAELLASGDYQEPVTMGNYLELRELAAALRLARQQGGRD